MGKLLVALSLISLIFLQIGNMLFPANPVMWLASNSLLYEIVRVALIPILIGLLITATPRHAGLRYVIGALAVVLLAATAYLTYENYMQALDMLAFGGAGLAIGTMVLEIRYTIEDVVDLEALRQAKRGGPLIR